MTAPTTCQICERLIKATTGVIAHHGYMRPWKEGWQSGSCFGARFQPYEVACDALPLAIESIRKYIENQKKLALELIQNPPETIKESYISSIRERKEYTRPEGFDAKKNIEGEHYGSRYAYEYEHRAHYQLHVREAENAERDLKRLEKRLADWKPQA